MYYNLLYVKYTLLIIVLNAMYIYLAWTQSVKEIAEY
jgi:hypothetical protein